VVTVQKKIRDSKKKSWEWKTLTGIGLLQQTLYNHRTNLIHSFHMPNIEQKRDYSQYPS